MSLGRREFLRLAGLVAAGASVSACSPLYRRVGEALAGPVVWTEGDGRLFRTLSRLTFGPTLAERRLAAEVGTPGWIEGQLDPSGIDDLRAELLLRPLTSLTLDAADLAAWDRQDVIEELRAATLLRQVYSRRQLYEVMVGFWTDHFNISVEKGDCWYLKTPDDRAVVRRHALGNFHDLVLASAHSPAMLVYLDNQANDRRAPNENYARELLELHTLGVDGGYTQADVMDLARCLTGWTVRDRFWRGQFTFRPEMHDEGTKTVMGVRLEPAGEAEAERVIEHLVSHPATAGRLARKVTRRFLALETGAEEELIAAAAKAFLASGGEIRSMLRVILLDGLAAQTEMQPKFKRPGTLVVSALRMLDASTDGGAPVQEHLHRMGQPLFGWPSPDGPPEEAGFWQSGLLARWKFAYELARGALDGTRLDVGRLLEAAAADGPGESVAALANVLLGSPLPAQARDGIARLVDPEWGDDGAAALVAGLIASPAFQWN